MESIGDGYVFKLVAMDTNFTLLRRSGLWFSYQHYGLTPDIVTMAKVPLTSIVSLLYPASPPLTHPPNHKLLLPAPPTSWSLVLHTHMVAHTRTWWHAWGVTRVGGRLAPGSWAGVTGGGVGVRGGVVHGDDAGNK